MHRSDVVPKTAGNFRALCTGERGVGRSGKPLHSTKGTRFLRVTTPAGFMCQGRDVAHNDGTGVGVDLRRQVRERGQGHEQTVVLHLQGEGAVVGRQAGGLRTRGGGDDYHDPSL
ncbi:hypothetical protein B296_00045715 [Ensete ventricosum]|uniref:PPIase cyclophilin-type domain-containing protein n=1 Tax=Ensete ventricosum TaxID=4639 RepID=A0A426Z6I2_ENSVE|nr:hypothetical protein B296_00045715 [Ensete ventricosum]